MVESQPSKLRRFAGVSERAERGSGRSATEILSEARDLRKLSKSGSNSVVESQPSKLLVAGSIPVSRSSFLRL